jgi:hypothetical protein
VLPNHSNDFLGNVIGSVCNFASDPFVEKAEVMRARMHTNYCILQQKGIKHAAWAPEVGEIAIYTCPLCFVI